MKRSALCAARHSLFAGLAMAILLAVSPAAATTREFGVLLWPTDYAYLAQHGVERDSSVLQKMSPNELNRLHRLINDERTKSEPQSRTKAVMDALAEFESNQQWEIANPGRRWNEKARTPAEASRN
jgi:hypothetical protein